MRKDFSVHTLLKKIKGTWSAPSLVCGYSQVQLLEDMHNCTSLKSVMFKKQLTLLAMSLTQPWHLFKGDLLIKIMISKCSFNPFASEAVYTHNFFFTACRTACKHAFRFLRVLPEAVSTRHSWLWQTLDDVYTRRCFSESEGTRFGAPGQKALPSVNEFTLLWIFA